MVQGVTVVQDVAVVQGIASVAPRAKQLLLVPLNEVIRGVPSLAVSHVSPDVNSDFLTGFAGVYFEKILKGSKQSVWLRNVELVMILRLMKGHSYVKHHSRLQLMG